MAFLQVLDKLKKEKMKENTLLKIALTCSLLGLAVLYFLSQKINFESYSPQKTARNIGGDVKIEGIVKKIVDRDNVRFIEVVQQSSLNVVLFTDDRIDLNPGDRIEVEGALQEYGGKEEVIAQKIVKK